MCNNMSDFDLESVLSDLASVSGVSGDESDAAALCAQYLSRYGSVSTDAFNNVICTVGEYDEGKKTLLIDAHLDEIGMKVTYITDDGFLKAYGIGIDARVLPASTVTVYARQRLKGVVTSVPPHLKRERERATDIDDLYIDVGLSGQSAKELVSLGDTVLIENRLERMGELVTSKALDDRCCCAAVIYALELLKEHESRYNIKVLFSSKEETGSQGARTAAYSLDADLALAVDVSFAKVHGEDEEGRGELGKGAMIGIAPTLSRQLSDALIEAAQVSDLPYQIEVMSGKTGTNADALAVAKGGVPVCTVSIPIRYMHTPVEAAAMSDIENTAKLIAELCERGLY